MPRAQLLIVDDLRENLIALEALIRQDDRVIHAASSGEQALALLLEHDFALAILDVQMPGMSGLELAELMRGTEKTRRIPIVFVSAGRDMNHAFRGYESGAVDFLYKPLDPLAVRSKVNVFTDLYRQRALLEETQRELERAVRAREDFMSMVSHELRTPLNTLHMQAQLRRRIHAGGADLSPEQTRKMLERDDQQIRNMVRLIDDLLDVTRMRRGTLATAPAPGDMARLVRRVVDAHAAEAEHAGCALSVQAPDSLPGEWDEFRIEQVVTNLLTNAFRYGAGRPVAIKLGARDDEVVLTVRDQGRGIAEQDLGRVFGQFERAVDARTVPGLGLGLYISRQIVEAHGGRIEVRSQLGQGATFEVRLPRRSPALKAA